MSRTETQPKRTFTLIEEGYQTVKLLSISPEVMAKNGNGKYLEATFEISEGEHEKRRIWHKFFVSHKNPMVKKIGMDQLGKMLVAVGVENGLDGIGDNSELEEFTGEELRVKVAINESPGFPPQNKITGFYANRRKRAA